MKDGSAIAVTKMDQHYKKEERILPMLYTIAIILIVLWLLGLLTSFTLGGFVHVLLVLAVIMVLVNLFNGRKSI